jgi:hypothetical protein
MIRSPLSDHENVSPFLLATHHTSRWPRVYGHDGDGVTGLSGGEWIMVESGMSRILIIRRYPLQTTKDRQQGLRWKLLRTLCQAAVSYPSISHHLLLSLLLALSQHVTTPQRLAIAYRQTLSIPIGNLTYAYGKY